MTELELLNAIGTAIEALAAEPLSDFEVYVLDQEGGLEDERIILNITDGREEGKGIRAGVGTFDEYIEVQMQCEFPMADTDANRDKAFSCITQLRKFVRDNRQISAGDDTAHYAEVSGVETGYLVEGVGQDQRRMRGAIVRGTWRIPEEVS